MQNLVLPLILYLSFTSLSLIKAQNLEISELQKKFEKVLDNFSQTNKIFQEITNQIKDIKFNFILKIKYSELTS